MSKQYNERIHVFHTPRGWMFEYQQEEGGIIEGGPFKTLGQTENEAWDAMVDDLEKGDKQNETEGISERTPNRAVYCANGILSLLPTPYHHAVSIGDSGVFST